jgi:hypothetical protein
MYLANKLHKDFNEHLSSRALVGKSLTYTSLSKILNTCMRKYGIRVRVSRDNTLRSTTKYRTRQKFNFSGYFITNTKKNSICITVHVPDNADVITLTTATHRKFLFDFSRVIQHELIHKIQYTYRPEESDRVVQVLYSESLPKIRKEEIQYLSVRCEVEAYAHDIAMEIKKFYSTENTNSVIKNIDRKSKLESYIRYKTTFKGLQWDKLKKSLLRKVWKWLPSAHIPLI